VYGPEKALPYVVPTPNVRIECPLALVDRVLDARPAAAREAAHAFGKFLFTPEAQVGMSMNAVSWVCVRRVYCCAIT
jgi:sulfate transport system substrate-binding protein